MSEWKLVSKNARKLQNSQWLGMMLSTFTIQMESGIRSLTYSIKTEFTPVESKKRRGWSFELMAVGASELGHHPLPVVRLKRLVLRL